MFLNALVQHQQPEWRQLLMVLSPKELASLWHVPHEDFTTHRIVWAGARVPEALTKPPKDEAQAVCMGTAVSRGQDTPVYLARTDRAFHHFIVGKTGMGKSTLIHNLVAQDIAAGCGVAVIDPHGKLIEDILATIPTTRADEVVLLNCGQTDYPVPLNPFRMGKDISHDTAFTYLYWVLRKIYEGIWLEGRTDLVMQNVLQALLCDPEATPLDIERLFTEESYRAKIVHLMEDSDDASLATLRYWREFGNRSAGDRTQLAQPILHRTGAFLGNRALEYMTCHPHSLDFPSLVRENKIVLINLSGNAIRSEIGGLGAIFLAGFYLASELLGYIPDEPPPPFLSVCG